MRRVLPGLLSLALMALILIRIDRAELWDFLKSADPLLFAAAILLFLPQTAVSAFRWQCMIRHRANVTLAHSTRLILAASALNLFLPSKLGDLAKARFLHDEGRVELARGVNITLFERYLDLAALGIVLLVAAATGSAWTPYHWLGVSYGVFILGLLPVLLFLFARSGAGPEGPGRAAGCFGKIRSWVLDARAYLAEVRTHPVQLFSLILFSILLWALHLFQFLLIFRCLGSDVPWGHVFALVPLGILVGLLPVTVAGIGTRDAAFLLLFSPLEQASRVAGVGLFASFRYLVVGTLGIPFLQGYLERRGNEGTVENTD